jgi:O-antigen/teichoic acid export membrane protein
MYSNLGATSRLITSKADMLILGGFADPVQVGYYRLARALSDPLMMFFGPVYTAVYPEISRLVEQGDFRQIRSLQGRLSKTVAAVIFPACLLLTLGLAWFIPVVMGEQYLGGTVLAQIMVWQIVWTPLIWVPGWLLSTERTRLLAGLNWLDALDYLILLLLLVAWLGALGAAVATLLRFIIWTIMALCVIAYVNRTMSQAGSRR